MAASGWFSIKWLTESRWFRMSTGQPEFDFNVNRYDIQIPADVFESTSEKYKRQDRPMHSVPESDYSLRVRTPEGIGGGCLSWYGTVIWYCASIRGDSVVVRYCNCSRISRHSVVVRCCNC